MPGLGTRCDQSIRIRVMRTWRVRSGGASYLSSERLIRTFGPHCPLLCLKSRIGKLLNPANKPMPPVTNFKRVDVRELIRRGSQPLPEIQQRADKIQAGEGLIVIAPFLPSPLIELLGGQGFRSKLERGKGADWVVYFWREAA